MRKSRVFEVLKKENVLVLFFVFLGLIFYKGIMNDTQISIFGITMIWLFLFFLEWVFKDVSFDMSIHRLYLFLWKMSIVFIFLFLFYTLCILKNPIDIEAILLVCICFCPLVLKSLLYLFLFIQTILLQRKYSIQSPRIVPAFFQVKRLVIKKEDLYKNTFQIVQIFANHRKQAKLNSDLKTALLVFNKSAMDQKILKTFHLENKMYTSKKSAYNQVSYKERKYKKGSVPTILSSCTHFIKNNRKCRLNSSAYRYILNCYQRIKSTSDKVIGYMVQDHNASSVFLGFIALNHAYQEGYFELKEKIPIITKRSSNDDIALSSDDFYSTSKKKFLLHCSSLLDAIQVKKESVKSAMLFYVSSKMLVSVFVLLSFYTSTTLLTIEQFLLFEFLVLPIAFFLLSCFSGKLIKRSFFFLSLLLLSLFNVFFFYFLYPYFPIDLFRSYCFCSILLQSILGTFFLLDLSFVKEKRNYSMGFITIWVFAFLFLYKMGSFQLSFFSLFFLLFLHFALFSFFSLLKRLVYNNKVENL